MKLGLLLPSVPKNENPGKSDFKTIRELVQYITEEDEKKKIASAKWIAKKKYLMIKVFLHT